MCRKNVLTIVAVAILALAIGQVQAVTVTVPNSGFELIYKPGTDILGVVSGGGWTMGVGPACPIDSGQYIFDDGTTGDVADIPGWLGYDRQGWIDLGGTYGRDETTGNFQGSVTTQGAPQHDGIHCFNVNGGGYGNAAGGLIVSDASLGNVKAGIYVLSMYVKNAQGAPALPRVLDLLADGVVVTPTSSVDPAPSDEWQEYTRTYDFTNLTSYVGQAITIVLGVGRPLPDGATGAQSHFDNVSLSYEFLLQASNPIPADEATDVCRNVVLSWTPGMYADKHDVYFGTDFDDVTDATTTVDPNNVYKGRQDLNSYPIAGTLNLDFGQTYYWRIDEVSAPPDDTIFKGDVWQFTTEPLAYPVENVTATASSSEADKGPENTLSLEGDLHSTDTSAMWLSTSEVPGGAWIQYEFDKIYKLHEMWVWNYNGESLNTAFGLRDVTIKYSANGVDFTTLGTTHELPRAPGTDGYAHDTPIALNGAIAKYVRISANSNWGVGLVDQYGLSEVRFLHIPVWPRDGSPQDGSEDAPIDVTLSWTEGRETATNEVYLGTDEQAVTDSAVPAFSIAAGGCISSYGPLSLDLDTNYYWKVAAVNNVEDPNVWESDVWSFTTVDSLIVDDMEPYGDGDVVGEPGSRIWYTWKDGEGWTDHEPTYGGNGTGSIVDLGTDPALGRQSLMYNYSNNGTNSLGTGGKNLYSEATAAISDLSMIDQDWTKGGAKALSLQFYGDPDNAAGATEQMYVKLNGQKVVYDGDMADITEPSWHEWRVNLADFGVTLANVTQISIGFGNEGSSTPGGTGTVLFDEIRLYPSKCVLSRRSADLAKVDYVQDCVVDYKELEVMAENWLAAAAAPGTVLNGDFEEIYKPGSVTITAELGGWTQGVGPDTLMDSGTASYSDGTDGDWVDVPGWIGADPEGWVAGGGTYERDTNFPNRQGSIQANGVEGSYCFLANGSDWGNPAGGLIVSDAPLGNVEDGIYTLSMVANGGATPVVLELLAGGIALTPASSADPALTGDFQEFSRTYDSASLVGFLGEPLTIRLGVGREASGTQTRFDNVTLFHSPEPLPTEILRLAGRRVDLYEDKKIDFKDFAELAVWWLDEQLWPQ